VQRVAVQRVATLCVQCVAVQCVATQCVQYVAVQCVAMQCVQCVAVQRVLQSSVRSVLQYCIHTPLHSMPYHILIGHILQKSPIISY